MKLKTTLTVDVEIELPGYHTEDPDEHRQIINDSCFHFTSKEMRLTRSIDKQVYIITGLVNTGIASNTYDIISTDDKVLYMKDYEHLRKD